MHNKISLKTMNFSICYVAYIFLIGWTFMNVAMTMLLRTSEFTADAEDFLNQVTETISARNWDTSSPQTLVDSLSGNTARRNDAFRFYLLDSDYNIVAKSGSFIKITKAKESTYEEPEEVITYLNIEDAIQTVDRQNWSNIIVTTYLTGNYYNTAALVSRNEGYTCSVEHLEYARENGLIIPVRMTLRSKRNLTAENYSKTDYVETVVLSDLTADDYYDYDDTCSIDLRLDPVDYDFDCIDGTCEDVKRLYDRWEHELLTDSDIHAGIDQALSQEEGSGYNYVHATASSESYWIRQWQKSFMRVSVGGTDYCLVMIIGQDVLRQTLKDSIFRTNLITELLICFLALAYALYNANSYYSRLSKLEVSRKAFTSAAAHELKTPLSIIQNQGEYILEHVDPDRNDEYAASICEEAARMNKLVVSFLRYNRLTSVTSIEKNDLDLSALLHTELEKYVPLMEDMNENVMIDVSENIHASCNHELMTLAIDNLLQNAMKYASVPGTAAESPQIHISLHPARRHGFRLSVTNPCDTANFPHTKDIWSALTRGDASRTRSGNSTGMGLAITEEILKLHDFKYGCRVNDGTVEFYIEK